MPKITLEQIQEELKGTQWICNDTKYVNLKTVMSFTCPEGHLVEQTWDKMRHKRFCPVCASNLKKPISRQPQRVRNTASSLLISQVIKLDTPCMMVKNWYPMEYMNRQRHPQWID